MGDPSVSEAVPLTADAGKKPRRPRKKRPEYDPTMSVESRLDVFLADSGMSTRSPCLSAEQLAEWNAARERPEPPPVVNVDTQGADGPIPFFDPELLASRDLSDPLQAATALSEREVHRRRSNRETRLLHLYQSQLAYLSTKLLAVNEAANAERYPARPQRRHSVSRRKSSAADSADAESARAQEAQLLLGHPVRHSYHLRRFSAVPLRQPRHPSSHCTFTAQDGQACTALTLPFTGFCPQHILNDTNQTLFVRCTAEGCAVPVVAYARGPVCQRHTYLVIAQSLPGASQ